MAIFKSTAFSRLVKSFGNLTAYRSRGRNIVKEKVTDVRNPNTLEQQKQRLRMSTLVELAGICSQPIALGFPQRPVEQTPENCFVQVNKDVVTVDEELVKTILYEKLIVSKGNRALPEEIHVALDEENAQLEFQIKSEEFVSHAAADDLFYAAVLEKQKQRMKLFPLGARKTMESVSVTLPGNWLTQQLAIYVFVVSKDRMHASTTRYLIPE